MEKTQRASEKFLKSNALYRYQLQIFFCMTTLYTFYFVANNNLGPAIKPMQDELGISSARIGILFTVFTLLFATGQFFSGYIADRFSPKKVMLIGAIGATIANILFGISNSLLAFTCFWGMNALFLAMGWSPGCKILYNWLPPKRWGLFMGIYNAFSFLGGVIVYPFAGWVIIRWGWRAAFIVPPLCLAIWAGVFAKVVKNTPQQAGYKIEWKTNNKANDDGGIDWHDYKKVLLNPLMNLVCISAICSQFVRWGLVNWGVKILTEPLGSGGFGLTLVLATALASLMHWGGALFSIVLGYVSDTLFKGQRWQSICIGFILSFIALILLYQIGADILTLPAGLLLLGLILFVSGGCIQGLQAPIFNLPEAILGSRLSGTATGIVNGWSYIGASLSGIFLGWLFDGYGFNMGILFMAIISLIGGMVICLVRR
ncbi:MFS transporter [Clostridiaceae bacterium 35-E11]